MKRCLTCNVELQNESNEICFACRDIVGQRYTEYYLKEITTLEKINSEIKRINGSYRNRPLLQIKEPLTRLYALKQLIEKDDSEVCKKKTESILKQIQEKKNRNLKAKRDFKAQLY